MSDLVKVFVGEPIVIEHDVNVWLKNSKGVNVVDVEYVVGSVLIHYWVNDYASSA